MTLCLACLNTGVVEAQGDCSTCEGLCCLWIDGIGRECPDCEGTGGADFMECQDCDATSRARALQRVTA